MKTIKHKHHIIPKHMGGTDDPENLIELTIEEHAEAHRELYEKYSKWQDKVAWLSLSEQINSAERHYMIVSAPKSEEFKRKCKAIKMPPEIKVSLRVKSIEEKLQRSKQASRDRIY